MAKILVQREKREVIDGKERIIIKQKIIYVRDLDKDVQTKHGVIRKEELKKKDGNVILSSHGKEFVVFSSTFSDDLSRIKRLPQSMIAKDVGYILAVTGIGKKSTAIDAGVGNGFLTASLARVCKSVVGYEINPLHFENAKENLKSLGMTNVKIYNTSVEEPLKQKNVDLVTLDVPEPWRALASVYNALKVGGFLVTYSPSTTQVHKTVVALKNFPGFLRVKTVELIERSWKVDGESVRPENIEIGHTAFMTFVRKIS